MANLGPGFDILAMALQLQNEVVAQARPGQPLTVSVSTAEPAAAQGESAPSLDPRHNRVAAAYTAACDRLGVTSGERGAELRCTNAIPMGRGLGSSAAAALSGILAAVALHRAPWGETEILACATELEGHPDNAAAALLGGLVICAPDSPPQRCDVPEELHALVLLPHATLSTTEARRVVPQSFSRQDAVFNAARCALLVRALLTADHAGLRTAMEDRWHQRQRAQLLPGLAELIEAAYAAGAAGACLAGAGPSVLGLTAVAPERVASGMRAAAERLGMAAELLHLRPRNFGARVDLSP